MNIIDEYSFLLNNDSNSILNGGLMNDYDFNPFEEDHQALYLGIIY